MKLIYKKETFRKKADWLKARGIGGSDSAAIIGKSKWLTANDIYNRIVLGKEKPIRTNELMEDGTKAEKHLAELFALNNKELKITAPRGYWLFRRKDHPLMTVSPDRLAVNKITKKKYGVEIKKVRLYKKEDKTDWEDGNIPDQYYCQTLKYMIVMNDLDGVYIYAELDYYDFNEETKKYEYSFSILKQFLITRDEKQEDIKFLEKCEIKFIEENINKKQRPKTII